MIKKLNESNENNNNMKNSSIIPDWRNIENGLEIPAKYYADQPYLLKADDGAWVCVVTTNIAEEGKPGQCIISTRSMDMGKTWSEPVLIEDCDGREASYAVIYKTPYGRIYVFYNHNTDNIRKVKADNPPYIDGYCYRVDSLGYFVFKYSDDNGKTWSKKRYNIPVREFRIDIENADRGRVKYFWNVGKAFEYNGSAYVPLHKVGGFGDGFFTKSEGALLKSDNLLIERDPEKIRWETLPEGDIGIRTPAGGGPIAEEHSFLVLSDGSFYVVFRTVDGHPCEAYSRDGGKTWEPSRYKRYADGRLMKHPRAANFVWKCKNGKFLYWFHNHGGKGYEDRNPAWICLGEEFQGSNGNEIKWSQPEILLYSDDPYVRLSYPDMIEDGEGLFITETNKNKARVHQIDQKFINKFWNYFDVSTIEKDGLIYEMKAKITRNSYEFPREVYIPELPIFLTRDQNKPDYGTKDLRQGFTIEFYARLQVSDKNIILIDSRKDNEEGLYVGVRKNNSIGIVLNDGRTQNSWYTEPGIIKKGNWHHVGIIIDGGPKIISFVIDGKFCDGADYKQFGWGRFSKDLRHANGNCIKIFDNPHTVNINDEVKIKSKDNENYKNVYLMRIVQPEDALIVYLRFYKRALMTTELIGNYRAQLMKGVI